jgi:hypothetical protein
MRFIGRISCGVIKKSFILMCGIIWFTAYTANVGPLQPYGYIYRGIYSGIIPYTRIDQRYKYYNRRHQAVDDRLQGSAIQSPAPFTNNQQQML